ncbi:hypothetical protein QJS66_12800 [Kocuria rhizophila]|nr:hypothetical protein QJS66_12800 [Kocuria rhizophila]
MGEVNSDARYSASAARATAAWWSPAAAPDELGDVLRMDMPRGRGVGHPGQSDGRSWTGCRRWGTPSPWRPWTTSTATTTTSTKAEIRLDVMRMDQHHVTASSCTAWVATRTSAAGSTTWRGGRPGGPDPWAGTFGSRDGGGSASRRRRTGAPGFHRRGRVRRGAGGGAER